MENAGTSGGGESGGGGMACSSGGGVLSFEERSETARRPAERLLREVAPTARAITARVAELELRLDPGERWMR